MELLDSENFAAGVGMTQQGRANLMAKLAEGHNAGTCDNNLSLAPHETTITVVQV